MVTWGDPNTGGDSSAVSGQSVESFKFSPLAGEPLRR